MHFEGKCVTGFLKFVLNNFHAARFHLVILSNNLQCFHSLEYELLRTYIPIYTAAPYFFCRNAT